MRLLLPAFFCRYDTLSRNTLIWQSSQSYGNGTLPPLLPCCYIRCHIACADYFSIMPRHIFATPLFRACATRATLSRSEHVAADSASCHAPCHFCYWLTAIRHHHHITNMRYAVADVAMAAPPLPPLVSIFDAGASVTPARRACLPLLLPQTRVADMMPYEQAAPHAAYAAC